MSEESVPDRTTNAPSLVSGLLEPLSNLQYGCRRLKRMLHKGFAMGSK
jgi:hypothetical protein